LLKVAYIEARCHLVLIEMKRAVPDKGKGKGMVDLSELSIRLDKRDIGIGGGLSCWASTKAPSDMVRP
jgi:hypothetical protein